MPMRLVHFKCPELKITVSPKLTGPTVIVQHHGEGWQNVQRHNRISLTEWQGGPAYELQIPCIFDQYGMSQHHGSNRHINPHVKRTEGNIEKECRQMARLSEVLPNKPRPPIFLIESNGLVPFDHARYPNKRWFISVCTWGDYIVPNKKNYRTRQEFTVTVWEYRPDTVIKMKERLPDRPVPKTYRIKKGDTLPKVAAYFYGDQSEWHDIAKLNKISHPLKLKAGRTIKLPKA